MPERSDFFAQGSRWIRADFHLHTRLDKQFRDSGAEDDFVSCYVAALKNAEIGVGVISNHNKFFCEEYKALRKAAGKEDIFILPGVELSVKDGSGGIHTLVLFHPDWIDNKGNHDYINEFLDLTFAGQTGDRSNARSNHDLHETIRELDKFGRDYLLIFAHVEQDSGLWSELSGGRIQELGRNEPFRSRTAAFQKVRTHDRRQQVQNWLGPWYPSEVEGSDPKSLDEIGRGQQTFIKIGAFTFEAVQFALKPGAGRVSNAVAPGQAHSWLRSVRFEGGILGGESVDFSREMNCLIGIRGSGKSAVLEALRYGLELQVPDTMAELDLQYKQELVRFALGSGGRITIELQDAQGRCYQVRRIFNERADLYFDGELRPGVRIPLKNPLFFGQKELVARGEHSEQELVERLLGSKLDAIRQEILGQGQRVREVLAGLDRLNNLDEMEGEHQSRRKDAEFRLALFRQYGVEQQLRRQVEFNADVANASRIIETAESFVRSFDAFLKDQEAELGAKPTLESKENADIMAEINAAFNQLQEVPAKARRLLTDARGQVRVLRQHLQSLEARREALKDEFAATERKLSEKLKEKAAVNIRPDDFVKLNSELRRAKLALEEIAKSRTRRDTLRDQLLKELKTLSDLWHKEFRQIEAEVGRLNSSQDALQIMPIYKGHREPFIRELQAAFRGSKLRETTLRAAIDERADFISVYESLDSICNSLGDSGDAFRRYFNESKSHLLTWQVPNQFKIEYHGRELREHSLGQRASALILFILSQRDNDVIIIDQPEDDLDSQTIFEDVIKLIRTLKQDTQFIFATHDANFPVLGDAEQVGTCSFRSGRVSVQVGSIDNPQTQKSIVSIMEGGQEAFARRKEIYELWKQ